MIERHMVSLLLQPFRFQVMARTVNFWRSLSSTTTSNGFFWGVSYCTILRRPVNLLAIIIWCVIAIARPLALNYRLPKMYVLVQHTIGYRHTTGARFIQNTQHLYILPSGFKSYTTHYDKLSSWSLKPSLRPRGTIQLRNGLHVWRRLHQSRDISRRGYCRPTLHRGPQSRYTRTPV